MTNEIRLIHILSAIILVLTTFYSLWIIGRWLVHRPAFDIELIRVQTFGGHSAHITMKQIENSLTDPVNGNFFTADLRQVQRAFEQVPWVRKATVRRVWPKQLEVILEEQKVLAIWNETQLMNTYAEVFTANIGEVSELSRLPSLSGPDGTELKVVRMFQSIQDWVAQSGSTAFPVALTLNSRYSWSVKLKSGVTFNLGREKEEGKENAESELDASIQDRFLVAMKNLPLPEQDSGNKIIYVDLRYPLNRFAVRLGKESAEDLDPAVAD